MEGHAEHSDLVLVSSNNVEVAVNMSNMVIKMAPSQSPLVMHLPNDVPTGGPLGAPPDSGRVQGGSWRRLIFLYIIPIGHGAPLPTTTLLCAALPAFVPKSRLLR